MEDPLAAADRLSFGMAFLIFVSVAGIVLLMFLTTASETPSTSARAGSGKVPRGISRGNQVQQSALASAKQRATALYELFSNWFSRPPQQQQQQAALPQQQQRDALSKSSASSSRTQSGSSASAGRSGSDLGRPSHSSSSTGHSAHSASNPRHAAQTTAINPANDTGVSGKGAAKPTSSAPLPRAMTPPSPNPVTVASTAKTESNPGDLDSAPSNSVYVASTLVDAAPQASTGSWERADGRKARHRKTESTSSSSVSSQPSNSSSSGNGNNSSASLVVTGLSISDAALPQKSSLTAGLVNASSSARNRDALNAQPAATSSSVPAPATHVDVVGKVETQLATKESAAAMTEAGLTPTAVPSAKMAEVQQPSTGANLGRKNGRRSKTSDSTDSTIKPSAASNVNLVASAVEPSADSKSPRSRSRSKSPSALQTSDLPATAGNKSSALPSGTDTSSSSGNSMLTPPATPPSKASSSASSSPTSPKHKSVEGEKDTRKVSGVKVAKSNTGESARVDAAPSSPAAKTGSVASSVESSPKRAPANQYVRPPRFSPNAKASGAAVSTAVLGDKSPMPARQTVSAEGSRSSSPLPPQPQPQPPKKSIRPPPGLNVKPISELVSSTHGIPTPATPTSTTGSSDHLAQTPPPSPSLSSPCSPVQSSRSGSSLSLASPDLSSPPSVPHRTMPGELLPSALAMMDPHWQDSLKAGLSMPMTDGLLGNHVPSEPTFVRNARRASMGGSHGAPAAANGASADSKWYSPFDGGLSLTPTMSDMQRKASLSSNNMVPPAQPSGVAPGPPRSALPRIKTDDLWPLQNSLSMDYMSSQVDVWGGPFGLRNAGRVRSNPYDNRPQPPPPQSARPWSPESPSSTGHLLGHDFLAGLDRISGTIPPGTLLPQAASPRLGRVPSREDDFQYPIAGPSAMNAPVDFGGAGVKMQPRGLDLSMGADLHYRATAIAAAAQAANAPMVGSDEMMFYGDAAGSSGGWPGEQRRSQK